MPAIVNSRCWASGTFEDTFNGSSQLEPEYVYFWCKNASGRGSSSALGPERTVDRGQTYGQCKLDQAKEMPQRSVDGSADHVSQCRNKQV
jgi:hypothetical protein